MLALALEVLKIPGLTTVALFGHVAAAQWGEPLRA